MKWWNRHHPELERQVAFTKNTWQTLQEKSPETFLRHPKIEKIFQFLEKTIQDHIDIEEQGIFPFLKKHIPVCSPFLLLFCSEHREIIYHLNKLTSEIDRAKRNSDLKESPITVEELNECIFFLSCLCHCHLAAEDKSIFEKLHHQLTRNEKQSLTNLIRASVRKEIHPISAR